MFVEGSPRSGGHAILHRMFQDIEKTAVWPPQKVHTTPPPLTILSRVPGDVNLSSGMGEPSEQRRFAPCSSPPTARYSKPL